MKQGCDLKNKMTLISGILSYAAVAQSRTKTRAAAVKQVPNARS